MSFDSGFLELMPETVTVYARASASAYGVDSYSTSGTSVRARWVQRPGEVRTRDGNVVTYMSVLWLASTGTIRPSAKIVLPDNTAPPIALIERVPDEDGTHHHKVYFGWQA